MRRAFIGSILNGIMCEDGAYWHLLTPAFVPDSVRMNVRFIVTSMARMPRILCSSYTKDGGDSGRVPPV